MFQQPITVYEAVQERTAQTTIADVLLGAVAVVLGLAALAVLLGLGCAGILILVRRMQGAEDATRPASDATTLGLGSSPPSSSSSAASPSRPATPPSVRPSP